VVVIAGADIAAILVKAGLGTPEAVLNWLEAEFPQDCNVVHVASMRCVLRLSGEPHQSDRFIPLALRLTPQPSAQEGVEQRRVVRPRRLTTASGGSSPANIASTCRVRARRSVPTGSNNRLASAAEVPRAAHM
jgi:hypothetical protein